MPLNKETKPKQISHLFELSLNIKQFNLANK